MSSIFPRPGRQPYYIVAPTYSRLSAGGKVLHLLCHALNTRGENAFMVTDTINPDLLTPILTDAVIDSHFERQLTPIVVYPEAIAGNTLNAPVVVRYILNVPGLIGGDKTYAADEICFGYSRSLVEGQAAKFHNNVLFLPASDTSVFYPPEGPVVRRGSCFYCCKYRDLHGGELFDITRDSTEIYGPLSKNAPQTPQQIAELFRSCVVFYCYENSALSIEAALCGCPVVLLPNRFFTHKIGIEIIGTDGMAWGPEPAELARAKATVGRFRENFFAQVDGFWRQLEHFIAVTQPVAAATPYHTRIGQPHYTYAALQARGIFESFAAIRQSRGVGSALSWGLGATFLHLADTGPVALTKKVGKVVYDALQERRSGVS